MSTTPWRVAILDVYDATPNRGMACIETLVKDFAFAHDLDLTYTVYDVRAGKQVPDLSHHIYIATGGPGSPLETVGSDWEAIYFGFMDSLISHNQLTAKAEDKKGLFLICHSFQLFCRQYGFGQVSKRLVKSFGIFPVNKTEAGESESILSHLSNPFWIADFRDYQVTQPNIPKLKAQGGEVVCLEHTPPAEDAEPALMAIRFTEEIFGTQFHPEADGEGMVFWLLQDDRKQEVISKHSEAKYQEMLSIAQNPEQLSRTYQEVIPRFLLEMTSIHFPIATV